MCPQFPDLFNWAVMFLVFYIVGSVATILLFEWYDRHH